MFDKAKAPEYAIEYNAGHWVIAIRNQGQRDWTMLRDETKLINVQNEFGDVIQTRPAIQTFATMADAQDYADVNLRGLTSAHRKAAEIERAGKAMSGKADAYGVRDGLVELQKALTT